MRDKRILRRSTAECECECECGGKWERSLGFSTNHLARRLIILHLDVLIGILCSGKEMFQQLYAEEILLITASTTCMVPSAFMKHLKAPAQPHDALTGLYYTAMIRYEGKPPIQGLRLGRASAQPLHSLLYPRQTDKQ